MPRVLVWRGGQEAKPKHLACPECGAGPGAVKLMVLDRRAEEPVQF